MTELLFCSPRHICWVSYQALSFLAITITAAEIPFWDQKLLWNWIYLFVLALYMHLSLTLWHVSSTSVIKDWRYTLGWCKSRWAHLGPSQHINWESGPQISTKVQSPALDLPSSAGNRRSSHRHLPPHSVFACHLSSNCCFSSLYFSFCLCSISQILQTFFSAFLAHFQHWKSVYCC